MNQFCFYPSEVLGILEPLKWNDPGALAGIKDLSFTCWSVMLLTVFHKQILTGLPTKRKNFALDISLNTLQQCYNQLVTHPSLVSLFNEVHFQLFSPQCCILTFFRDKHCSTSCIGMFSRNIGLVYHIVHILIAFLCYLSLKSSVRDAQVFCFVLV